jgi:YesN/AraC family two-component response regulator
MYQVKYHLHQSRDTNWQMKKPHFHEDVEILLSLHASGEFFIGNALFPISEGSLFLFSGGTIHKSMAENQYFRYVLHVSPDTLRAFSTRISDINAFVQKSPVRCIHLDSSSAHALAKKFEELEKLEESKNTAFCSDIRKNIQLADIIVDVLTFFSDSEPENKLETSAMSQVTPILTSIRSHLGDLITLDVLSERFFISKYHLCHVFKSATGLSVMDYVINCRILKAQELLRQGMRVQPVGERTGFRNTAHFIRTFRTLTGVSPKRYAKKYLELTD